MGDERSRYQVVEEIHITSFKETRIKRKEIIATSGTPRKKLTDNGPLFQSKELAEFAKEEGFHHHWITLLHSQANGEVESFMILLNNAEQIANLQNKDKIERLINIIEICGNQTFERKFRCYHRELTCFILALRTHIL